MFTIRVDNLRAGGVFGLLVARPVGQGGEVADQHGIAFHIELFTHKIIIN